MKWTLGLLMVLNALTERMHFNTLFPLPAGIGPKHGPAATALRYS